MGKITGNEPAQPVVSTKAGYDNYTMKTISDVSSTGGMTIRQEFAKAAMQGLAANGELKLDEWQTAKVAVKMADYLIHELNRQ